MENNNNPSSTNWNKNDLKAYILLYCANADLLVKEEELAYINRQVKDAKYDSIRKEFDNDNDYQSITKIEEAINHLGYSKSQIEDLITDIKALFLADGKFDNMEQAIFRNLKHILKS